MGAGADIDGGGEDSLDQDAPLNTMMCVRQGADIDWNTV